MLTTKNAAFALAAAAGTWLVFGALATGFQRRLVFGRPELSNVRPLSKIHRTRQITLGTPDGAKLSGWLMRPRSIGPHPAVIYFGGREDDVTLVARNAETMFPGMTVLAVNYRGYGHSRGKPGERQLVDDARMLFDWIASLGFVNPERIAVVGRSLGTGIAVQLAAGRPVAAAVLVTPYDSLLAIAERRARTLPVRYLLRHRFESIKFAHQVAAPTYVLRAETDKVVPSRHTDRLVKHLKTLVLDDVVPDSTHADIMELGDAQLRIAAFLLKWLEPAPIASA